MGGTYTYQCRRCPLILELGEHTAWDEDGNIVSVEKQIACTACGTMHRLTQQNSTCWVIALPGPLRKLSQRTIRTPFDEVFQTFCTVEKLDWRLIDQHPESIWRVVELPCSFCEEVGRMVSLALFLYPDGYTKGAPRREICPVCGGTMRCVVITDSI